MFTDALSYPIRRGGWIMIVIGALLSAIIDAVKSSPMIGIVGLVVAIAGMGYFGAFYLDIVSTTMVEQDNVPDWPSFNNYWDDIFAPFLRLLSLVVISFGPAFAFTFFADPTARWSQSAFWGLIAYGCLYFPMSVLAVQAFGGLGAALPHVVFPGLARAMPNYLVAVVGLVIVYVALKFGQAYAADVPYVGWFLAAAVSIYVLMFQGRLIGLIYLDKRDALGWE
jgi:hypothetical protein